MASTSFVNYTAGSTSTPATDMVLQMGTTLVAAGWSFIEAVVISTTTYRVYQANSSVTQGNAPMVIALYYPTAGTGQIGYMAGETWDTSGKKLGYAMIGSAAQPLVGSPTWTSSALAAGVLLSDTTNAASTSLASVNTSTSYDVWVYADKSIFTTSTYIVGSSSSSGSATLLLCDPLYSDSPASVPPLVSLANSQSVAFRTRILRGSVGATMSNLWTNAVSQHESVLLGGLSNSGVLTDSLNGKVRGARFFVCPTLATQGASQVPGMVISNSIGPSTPLGWGPVGSINLYMATNYPRAGDTVTLDGTVWTILTPMPGAATCVLVPAGHSW